jgi:hypothetical protein
MSLPSHLPVLNRIVRTPRTWLLWLALVMLAAHSLATWHPYTHSPADQVGQAAGKHRMGLADCDLCLAGAANLGAAPPAVPMLLPPPMPQPAVQPARLALLPQAPARRPYAIRAPPAFS